MAFDTDDPTNEPREPTWAQTGNDTPGFLGGHSDFVLYGVYNGAFAKGPPDPTLNLDVASSTSGSNFMPSWRFVQSSNTNITAKQVRDTASPSGSNLRFTFAAGAAADEAYIEQSVPIGGDRRQSTGHGFRISGVRDPVTQWVMTIEMQYLDVDGNSVGSVTRSPITVAPGASNPTFAYYADTLANAPYPSNSNKLRLRIMAARGAAAVGATGTLDFASVRLDSGHAFYPTFDTATSTSYAPGALQQGAGAPRWKDSDGATRNLTYGVIPLAADVSKTGATFTDITGLSFPVTTGHDYVFMFVGTYTVANVTTGLSIGLNHPGGNVRAMVDIASTGPAALSSEWLTAIDTATGTATTDLSATARFWRVMGRYQCTTSGTFTLRYQRNGTNSTVAIQQGSGGWYVSD